MTQTGPSCASCSGLWCASQVVGTQLAELRREDRPAQSFPLPVPSRSSRRCWALLKVERPQRVRETSNEQMSARRQGQGTCAQRWSLAASPTDASRSKVQRTPPQRIADLPMRSRRCCWNVECMAVSVPGLGTITAKTNPSQSSPRMQTGDRRSVAAAFFVLVLEHPSAMQQATIVARKSPTLSPRTHLFIAGVRAALRAVQLEKPPSISEMNDLAQYGNEGLAGPHAGAQRGCVPTTCEAHQRPEQVRTRTSLRQSWLPHKEPAS